MAGITNEPYTIVSHHGMLYHDVLDLQREERVSSGACLILRLVAILSIVRILTWDVVAI